MFRVVAKGKIGFIQDVYAVRDNFGITEFLIWSFGEWIWSEADNYNPINTAL